jgi:hypothetical protein
LTNNIRRERRQYGHTSGMNKKTVWNMKLKGKDPRGRPRSRREQVDRDVREKEGRKNMAEN